MLQAFQLHLGHEPIIDMEGLYNHNPIDEEWQNYEDKYEYKRVLYYTQNAERVLELINNNLAELDSIDGNNYYIIMVRRY